MSATLVMQSGILLGSTDGRAYCGPESEFAAWSSRHHPSFWPTSLLPWTVLCQGSVTCGDGRVEFLETYLRQIPVGPRPVSTLPHQQASILKQKDTKRICRSRDPPWEIRFLAQGRLPLPSRPKTTGPSLMVCNAGVTSPAPALHNRRRQAADPSDQFDGGRIGGSSPSHAQTVDRLLARA